MDTNDQTKANRTRSPNYPAYSLEECVNKIRAIYEKNGKNGAHRSVVLNLLGYKTESGLAKRNISALKSFGLIYEENKRIILTDNALNILLYSHNSDIIREALQKAVLTPNIYNELYDKHINAFPVDDVLKSELIKDYNFNHKTVDAFIANLNASLKFSGLHENNYINTIEEKVMPQQNPVTKNILTEQSILNIPTIPSTEQQLHTVIPKGGKSFPVTLENNKEAMLYFTSLPVTKEDLELIKNYIDLMMHNWTKEKKD